MYGNFRKPFVTAEHCAWKGSWAAILLALALVLPASAQSMDSRIGKLDFQSGYPTDETVQKLYDELDFQRAVQAYIWALPMASYGAMADAHKALGTNSHTVIVADKSAEQQLIRAWCRDITYIRMCRGFLYLVGVTDW